MSNWKSHRTEPVFVDKFFFLLSLLITFFFGYLTIVLRRFALFPLSCPISISS